LSFTHFKNGLFINDNPDEANHKKNFKSQETNNKKNTNLKYETEPICIFFPFLSFFFWFLFFGSFAG